MKHSKDFIATRYKSYKKNLKQLMEKTNVAVLPLTKKQFSMQLEELSRSTKQGLKISKSMPRYIAEASIYNMSYNTARRIRSIVQKEQYYKEGDPDKGLSVAELRTRSTHELVNYYSNKDYWGRSLSEEIKDTYSELRSQGKTSKEAAAYISKYYFGS